MKKPLVIGVGQSWRSDDRHGPLVIEALQSAGESAVDFLIIEGDPLELLDLWEGRDQVVVIDSYHDEAASGELRHWCLIDQSSLRAKDLPLVTGGFSSHLFGLAETIKLGEALGRNPRELHLIGIPGQDYRLQSQPPLTKADLRPVIKMVGEILHQGGRDA